LDEERALLKALEARFPEYIPIVVLAIHTGPRRSELFRAVVGDYDFGTRKMAIHQTKTRNSPHSGMCR
jgi:integrase